MSVQSWVEEFIPDLSEIDSNDDALVYIEKKWYGFLPENLEKHGVVINRGIVSKVTDEDSELTAKAHLVINLKSWTLCKLHYSKYDKVKCPLYKVNGESCNEAWDHFVLDNDPQPMINLIKQAIQLRGN